jgi:hypothetical protein
MSDPFHQSREWLDLRYRVLQKRGGSCQLCGARGSEENPLQCDHIKPRSKHPELALVESNIQVLCRFCNLGKSNKDATDWRMKASSELEKVVARKTAITASMTALQKGKLEQLGWLRQHDTSPAVRLEAEKQYQAIWKQLEADWVAAGGDA